MRHLSNLLNQIFVARMKSCEKEKICHSQAFEALEIVKTLEVKTQEDILLFCAAMNLLNTYVKQPGRKFGYFFKSYLNYLFQALLENNVQGVNVGMDITITKKENAVTLVIIQIENIQFSFHQIRVSDEMLNLKLNSGIVKKLVFDGIKKQTCAATIFEMVKKI